MVLELYPIKKVTFCHFSVVVERESRERERERESGTVTFHVSLFKCPGWKFVGKVWNFCVLLLDDLMSWWMFKWRSGALARAQIIKRPGHAAKSILPLQNPNSPYMKIIYKMDVHHLSWNDPQFLHIWLSGGAIVIDAGEGYGSASFDFIKSSLQLPSLELRVKIILKVSIGCCSNQFAPLGSG